MKIIKMFDIMPIVMVGCTIMVIISLMIRDKKNIIKRILFNAGCGIGAIYIFSIFAIVTPYIFLSSISKDFVGIGLMIIIIFAVWVVVSLVINFKNKISFFKNRVKDVYIRDIDVKYSPAVVSYLMNNKLEIKKDLPATLLNLCSAGILKIEKNVDGKINIVDLKNYKEVQNLSKDEKYAYEMLVEGVTNKRINIWEKKVVEEYEKHNFSKANERPLGMYIIWLYVAVFIGIFIYMMITGEYTITGKVAEILGIILITSFIAGWEMIVLSAFKNFLDSVLNKKRSNEFREIYSKKGAREYTKWERFADFVEDFSLINERDEESVVIWGKYLSYAIALGVNQKCDKELYKKIEKEYSFEYNLFYDMFNDNK